MNYLESIGFLTIFLCSLCGLWTLAHYFIKGLKADTESYGRLQVVRTDKHNAHLGSRAE